MPVITALGFNAMVKRDKRALQVGFWIAACVTVLLAVVAPSLRTMAMLLAVTQCGHLLFKAIKNDQTTAQDQKKAEDRANVTLKDLGFIGVCGILVPYIFIKVFPSEKSYVDTTNFVLIGIFGLLISLVILHSLKYRAPIKKDHVAKLSDTEES